MQPNKFVTAAYVIVVLGMGLSLVAAVVPHPPYGYRLLFGALLLGMMPYVVYGVIVAVVRHWSMLGPGAVVLAADLLIRMPERFVDYHGEFTALFYTVSLVSTFVVLPLGIAVGKLLQRSSVPLTRKESARGAGKPAYAARREEG